jgi:hypothetical protein
MGHFKSMLLCAVVLCQPAFSQSTAGCLDGICINASIASLPASIPWSAVPNDKRRGFVPAEYATPENLADGKKRSDAGAAYAVTVYPEIGRLAREVGDLMWIERGHFDASSLAALKTLKSTCKQFQWVGGYASTGGFLTEITLMVYPAGAINNTSGNNTMRVHRISRIFPKIGAGDEMQDLQQKAQDLINLPVNDKARADSDRSPIASLSRSPAKGSATLDIQVMPTGTFDTRNFGKDPACKSRISAQ